jgi:hypothetical protein
MGCRVGSVVYCRPEGAVHGTSPVGERPGRRPRVPASSGGRAADLDGSPGSVRYSDPMPRRLDGEASAAIMRAAGVEPIEPYENSQSPWRCRCLACGHEVTPQFGNVRAGHAACGYCAGRKVDPVAAEVVMRAAGLVPLEPYPGSGQPWRCRCDRCENEVTPRYAAVCRGAGCRYCALETAGQSIRLDGEGAADLMRAAGLVPLQPYPGAGLPWLCRCLTCDRDVTPRYTDVRRGHGGCKRCACQKAGLGQRTEHEIAVSFMIEHGLEPLEQYPGAGKQWRCRCMACGDEVIPRCGNIKQGWGGCRRCGLLAASRTQRGPEVQAIADFRAVGLEPLEPYVKVMTPWRSRCQRCGREVSPLLNNIRKGQGSCGWCVGSRPDRGSADRPAAGARRIVRVNLLVEGGGNVRLTLKNRIAVGDGRDLIRADEKANDVTHQQTTRAQIERYDLAILNTILHQGDHGVGSVDLVVEQSYLVEGIAGQVRYDYLIYPVAHCRRKGGSINNFVGIHVLSSRPLRFLAVESGQDTSGELGLRGVPA